MGLHPILWQCKRNPFGMRKWTDNLTLTPNPNKIGGCLSIGSCHTFWHGINKHTSNQLHYFVIQFQDPNPIHYMLVVPTPVNSLSTIVAIWLPFGDTSYKTAFRIKMAGYYSYTARLYNQFHIPWLRESNREIIKVTNQALQKNSTLLIIVIYRKSL